jgi:hypothetical protein
MEFNKQYSQNITYIISITLILFGIILLLNLYQIDLNTMTNKKLLQEITIEGLKNKRGCCACPAGGRRGRGGRGGGVNDEGNINGPPNPNENIPPEPLLLGIKDFLSTDLERNFCKSFKGSSDKLEGQCNQLTRNNCKTSPCCVLQNGHKCVAGGPNGPTFQSNSNGAKLNIDYYYYQNKCYGKCPPKSMIGKLLQKA